ncbi:hypothetical protein C8Q77DRAFT_1114328 [Trametes polyzona]|nr:hypothetical protein C8Q77DRAFT_1114328 [Trametes polyzona]
MPATRTDTRHVSRSATLLRQSSADPVRLIKSEVVDLSTNDGTRPRKKLVVEKKSLRQRSKQKARAPLPPPSEIIEISSDDDDAPPAKRPSGSMSALERRVKELEEENKKWKQALLASQAAQTAQPQSPPSTPHKEPKPTPHAKSDQFISAIDEHVSCEICTMKMWNPYTLACGHTFCMDCLQDWFSTALAQHMATHPHYNPQASIPRHWRDALARPDLSIGARRQIELEIRRLSDAIPQPSYSCPTCRVEVRNKPAENFVVKHIVRTVAGAQGESCPKPAPPPRLGHRIEGPWDGFFPFAFAS